MERKTESIARCLSLLDKIRPFKNDEYYREWLSECEETELEEREIARLSESLLESALWELEETYKKIELIEIIRASKGGVWFGGSGGYGGWATIFSVCDDGLDCGGIQTENLYCECSMTEEEYAAALEELKNIDDEDLESMEECDPVTMAKNGCKPGVVYYVPLGTAKYNDELEYLEDIEDVFDRLSFEPLEQWIDMGSSELEEWVEVAKKLDRGIHSSYDS